jgi:hypothetical protein
MPMRVIRRTVFGMSARVLGVAMLLAACSSDASFESFAAGGSVMDAAPSSGPKPGDPGMASESPCPGFDPPRVGEACAMGSLAMDWERTCEYGHDLDPNCNDTFECTNGVWARERRSTCFGRCPTTIDAIIPGDPCENTEIGCSYLEGTCACVPESGDSGSPNAGTGRWQCASPPGKGCPAQRPSVGSDCVIPMDCDYGACALGREVVYSCLSTGLWVQADFPESCP